MTCSPGSIKTGFPRAKCAPKPGKKKPSINAAPVRAAKPAVAVTSPRDRQERLQTAPSREADQTEIQNRDHDHHAAVKDAVHATAGGQVVNDGTGLVRAHRRVVRERERREDGGADEEPPCRPVRRKIGFHPATIANRTLKVMKRIAAPGR